MERIENYLCEILRRMDADIVTYKKGFKDYIVKRDGFNSTSIPFSEIVIDKGRALKCFVDANEMEFVSSIWDKEIEGIDNLLVINETGWVEYNRSGSVKTFDNFKIEVSHPTFSSLLKAIVYTKCIKDEWSYETFNMMTFDRYEGKLRVRWFGDVYESFITLSNGARKMIPRKQYEEDDY